MKATLDPAMEAPSRVYARLLLQLDALMLQGQGNSEEADAVRGDMDRPWYAMTEEEQDRLSALSEDLYAITDGGPKPISMTAEERNECGRSYAVAYAQRDWDAVLKLLRRPPSDVPTHAIIFLHARMWERLGFPEVALVFMRHAARLNPDENMVSVMTLLEELGQEDEALACAESILANPQAGPASLYFAAGVLFRTMPEIGRSESQAALDRITEILRTALQRTLSTPRRNREIPDPDSYIVCMLGLCYQRLGKLGEALQVYSEALERKPRDYEVAAFRGLLLYPQNLERALGDFQVAIEGRVHAPWPYYFLARHALAEGQYHLTWTLSLAGLEASNANDKMRAHLHAFLAIAMTMLGQSPEKVRYNFEQALKWDPDNERIRRTREIFLETSFRPPDTARPTPWGFPSPASAAEVAALQPLPFLQIIAQQNLASAQRNSAAEQPLFPTAA